MASDWLTKTFCVYTLLRIFSSCLNYFYNYIVKDNANHQEVFKQCDTQIFEQQSACTDFIQCRAVLSHTDGVKFTNLMSFEPNRFFLDEFTLILWVILISFVLYIVKWKYEIENHKVLDTAAFEETIQTALTNSSKTMNCLEQVMARLNVLEKTVQLSTATLNDIVKYTKNLEEKVIFLEKKFEGKSGRNNPSGVYENCRNSKDNCEDDNWKKSFEYGKKLVTPQGFTKDSNSNCSSSNEQDDNTDCKEKEIFEQLKELQQSISKLRQQTNVSLLASQKSVILSTSSTKNDTKIEPPRPFYLSNLKYRQLSNIKTDFLPTGTKVQSRVRDIK